MQQVGRYTIIGPLGSGGMGTVFRAVGPDRAEVAVKVLNRLNDQAVGRFDRERRLLAEFGEEHGFVPLLDSGTSPQGPYLVMPVMLGSLRDRLDRGGAMPIPEVLAIGQAVASALGVAHDRGIVHRDLKPENILFTTEGQPLVSDLGLAKEHLQLGAGNSLSRTGEVRGSLHTMAPEQLRDSKRVGPRADVFALGATLYECLAGAPPFHGDHPVQVIEMIVHGRFAPLRAVRPEIPTWLANLVERCLSPKASRRPRNGRALVALLAAPTSDQRFVSPALVAGLAGVAIILGATASAVFVGGADVAEDVAVAPAAVVVESPEEAPPPPVVAPAPAPVRAPHAAYQGATATGLRVLTTLGQPSDAGMVQRVAVAPDGRSVLTLAIDGRLRVRDLDTGRDRLDLNVSAGRWVYGAQFVEDGAAIVVGHEDGQVSGWSVADGARRFLRRLHPSPIWGIHAAEGTRFVTVGLEGTLRSTATADATDSALIVDLGLQLAGSAVSLERGVAVVGGHAGELVCVDLATGTTRWRRERTHAAMVAHVVLSPDGALAVSCGADGRFGLWNVRDGTLVRMTAGITVDKWVNHVRAAVFWDETRLLTGGDDGLVRVWDRETGQELGRMAHDACVQTMARAGDVLVVGCHQGTVHLWDVERRTPVDRWPEHTGAVLALAWSEQGLVSAGVDRTLRRWDLTSGAPTVVRRDHEAAVVALATRTDSPWVVSSSVDGVVRAWRSDQPAQPATTLARRELPAWGLALLATDTVGVVTQGGSIGRLQMRGAPELGTLWTELPDTPDIPDTPDVVLRCAAPLPDGQLVVGGAGGRLCVVDARGVVTARADALGRALVMSVALVTEGRAAIAGLDDGRVVLWTLDDSSPRLIGTHANAVVAVAALPDGGAASASSDGTVRLWSIAAGEVGRVDLTRAADQPTCLAVAPDGRVAAGTARGVIVILDR